MSNVLNFEIRHVNTLWAPTAKVKANWRLGSTPSVVDFKTNINSKADCASKDIDGFSSTRLNSAEQRLKQVRESLHKINALMHEIRAKERSF